MKFIIARKGQVWAHNGEGLGERRYYWLDRSVLWNPSIGRPCTWETERSAKLAAKTLNGKAICRDGI